MTKIVFKSHDSGYLQQAQN